MFKVLLSAMIVLGLMAINSVLIKAPTPVKVKKTDNNRPIYYCNLRFILFNQNRI